MSAVRCLMDHAASKALQVSSLATTRKNGEVAMTRLPRVFIGSSSEGLRVAKKLESMLAAKIEPQVTVELWPSAFAIGETNIESLEKAIERADFALLVLTNDDKIVSRKQPGKAPRDNVIFEIGLFMGRIGRDRCWLVDDKRARLKLP